MTQPPNQRSMKPAGPKSGPPAVALGVAAIVTTLLIGGYVVLWSTLSKEDSGLSMDSSPSDSMRRPANLDPPPAPYYPPNHYRPNPEIEIRSEVQGDRIVVVGGPTARTNATIVVEPGRRRLYVISREGPDTLCSTTTDSLVDGDFLCYACLGGRFRPCPT